MNIPPYAYKGVKLTFDALSIEIAEILAHNQGLLNLFWHWCSGLTDVHDKVLERLERLQTRLLTNHYAIKYRSQVPERIRAVQNDLVRLTEIGAFLLEEHPELAEQGQRTHLYKKVSSLQDRFSKWLEMAWEATQLESPISTRYNCGETFYRHFLETLEAIEAQPMGWRDWFKWAYFCLTRQIPRSLVGHLKAGLQSTYNRYQPEGPDEQCKYIAKTIYRWRKRLEKGPNINLINDLKWASAGFSNLFLALATRFEEDIDQTRLYLPEDLEDDVLVPALMLMRQDSQASIPWPVTPKSGSVSTLKSGRFSFN